MTTNLWVEQSWYDYKLKWEPREYGGVEMLHVPSDHIWKPDVVSLFMLRFYGLPIHRGSFFFIIVLIGECNSLMLRFYSFCYRCCTISKWKIVVFGVELKQIELPFHVVWLLLCSTIAWN